MERPRFVLGLKAETNRLISEEEDSDDNFFSSDSGNDGGLSLKRAVSMNVPVVAPKPVAKADQRVNNLTDASTRITSIFAQLEDYSISPKEFSSFYLVPDSHSSDEVLVQVKDFISGKITEFTFDDDMLDDSILAQIDLVKYSKDPSIDLGKHLIFKIDSRVSSLVHFLLAKGDDRGKNAYHLLSSVEDMLKFPAFAPVSNLFPDFTLSNVIDRIAQELCLLFPKHPILPSVMHSLTRYAPNANSYLPSDDLPDDDFSDSFFESLQQITAPKAAQTFQVFIDDRITNSLHPSTAAPKIETISVTLPPSTFTFVLPDGSESLPPPAFSDWLVSMRTKIKRSFYQTHPLKSNGPQSYQSEPLFNVQTMSNSSTGEDTCIQRENDEEYLFSLYEKFDQPNSLLVSLPQNSVSSYFPIYYPTLQVVNTANNSTVIKRGCPYPLLISSEFQAHTSLVNRDTNGVKDSVSGLLSMISNSKWDIISMQPLKEKRPFPSANICEIPDIVSILALSDIELIFSGRSPLNGALYSASISSDDFQHPAANKENRKSALYSMYTQLSLPPYICFKVGFALAVLISDSAPKTSLRIVFEILFMIQKTIPQLVHTPLVRFATLLFADLFDKTDCYFYSALAIDTFFLFDTSDNSFSSYLAQISYKNRDMVRGIFHYVESIKRAVSLNKTDEALYIGQLVASIYSDHGLSIDAISTLTFLLKDSYEISLARRIPSRIEAVHPGSLRIIKHVRSSSFNRPIDFKPSPASINTAIAGALCVNLLISNKLFLLAEQLLQSISVHHQSGLVSRMLMFLRAKLLLKQNQFNLFLKALPPLEQINPKGNSSSRLNIHAGAAFDVTAASFKLLSKGYLERGSYSSSLFWSEVIIQTTPRGSFKELGTGYLSRGQSLCNAYHHVIFVGGKMILHSSLSPLMAQFGEYEGSPKEHNRVSLAQEALSSYSVSRICFDRVGSLRKSVEVSLRYIDLVLRVFFNPLDKSYQPPEKLLIGGPILEIKLKKVYQSEQVKINPFVLDSSNIEDHIGVMCKSVEKNSSRIMNPLFIIWSQILLSKYNAFLNDSEKAKTYFEFSYNNFLNHFTCGANFLPHRFSISTLRICEVILITMSELLLWFEKDFVNEHLVVFDILNDIKTQLGQRMRSFVKDSKTALASSIDIDITIHSLNNPKMPDFIPILKEIGVLDKLEGDALYGSHGYSSFMKMINSNIRLFETQKLTEEEMHNRNRSICHKIELYTKSIRLSKESTTPSDPSFASALRHSPTIACIVFVIKLFESIVVYLPYSGDINVVHLSSSQSKSAIIVKSHSHTISLNTSASVFLPEFFEALASYLFVDKKLSKGAVNPKSAEVSLQLAKRALFSNLLDMCPIFSSSFKVIEDNHSLGESSFFSLSHSKKGHLFSLDSGINCPIVFIPSRDLTSLPFEMMFPDALVLRGFSYCTLLLHHSHLITLPRVVAFRWFSDPQLLLSNGIQRSTELIQDTIASCGGGPYSVPFVSGVERVLPMPFPLFSSNRITEHYSMKYDFCSFYDIQPYEPPHGLSTASLFIFTISDICELPFFVENLMKSYPLAFFMFIPAVAIRDAFAEMKLIFARQKQRIMWVMNNQSDTDGSLHIRLSKNGVEFVGALKTTLMKKLHVPILLYSPLSS